MKYEIKVSGLENKLPDSFDLPPSFCQWVDECRAAQRGDLGWFAIKYSSPKALLGFDPKESLIPFLSLPDGGLVAFWLGPKRSVAIVSIGHDGDAKLVGASWSDFLSRWSAKKTGVPDLDDRELQEFPKIKGIVKRPTPLQAKQREFKKWLKTHQADKKTRIDEAASERIRKEIHRIMKKHIKVLSSGYGRRSILVTCTSRSYKVDWDCTPPQPCPEAERLKPVMQKLAQLLGRSLKKSDITVINSGMVFVDGNTCLGDPNLYADIE